MQTACQIKTDEEEGLAMNSCSHSADCQMQTLFSKRDSYAICGTSNLKIYTRQSWWIPSLNSEVLSGAQCQVSHKSSTLKFVAQALEVQAEVNCLEFDFKFKSTQNFKFLIYSECKAWMQLGFWKVLFWLWCKRVCSGFQSCEVRYTRHGSRWWRLNGNQVHQWHRPGLPRPVHLHLHHCGHQCGESASSVEFLKSNVQFAKNNRTIQRGLNCFCQRSSTSRDYRWSATCENFVDSGLSHCCCTAAIAMGIYWIYAAKLQVTGMCHSLEKNVHSVSADYSMVELQCTRSVQSRRVHLWHRPSPLLLLPMHLCWPWSVSMLDIAFKSWRLFMPSLAPAHHALLHVSKRALYLVWHSRRAQNWAICVINQEQSFLG